MELKLKENFSERLRAEKNRRNYFYNNICLYFLCFGCNSSYVSSKSDTPNLETPQTGHRSLSIDYLSAWIQETLQLVRDNHLLLLICFVRDSLPSIITIIISFFVCLLSHDCLLNIFSFFVFLPSFRCNWYEKYTRSKRRSGIEPIDRLKIAVSSTINFL